MAPRRALCVVLLAATALCSAADTQALGSTLLCTGPAHSTPGATSPGAVQFVPSAVFGDDTQVDVVVATPAEGDVTAVLVHAAPLGGRLSSGLLGAALSEAATCGSTHTALHVPVAASAGSAVVVTLTTPALLSGQTLSAWYQVGGTTWVGPATWSTPTHGAAPGFISRRSLLQDATTPGAPGDGQPVSSSEGGSDSSDEALGPVSSSSATDESGQHMYSDSSSATDGSSDSGTDWYEYNGTSTSSDYFPSSSDYAYEEEIMEEELEQMLENSTDTNVTATPAAATPTTPTTPAPAPNVTAPATAPKDNAAAAAAASAHPPPAAAAKPPAGAAPVGSTSTTSTSSSSDGEGHVLRHARTHLIGFFTSTDTTVHPGIVALIVLVLVGGSGVAVFAWWRSNRHTASAMVPSGAAPQLEMLPTSSRSGGGGGGHSGTPLLAASRGPGGGAKPPLMGGAGGKGKLGVTKKAHGGGGHFELLGSEDV